jgi:Uma2 family endonuclease
MSIAADPAAVPAAPAPSPAPSEKFHLKGRICIPAGITDLESFRRWAHSDAFPEHGRIDYLNGAIWVDLTLEQLYSHNQVKGEIGAVLHALAKASGLGRYLADGMRLSNPATALSTEPDGSYVSYAAVQQGRVRLIPSPTAGGVTELEGAPDMVLEVVSESSVDKDTVQLPEAYRRSGIPEFWRVDARAGLRFEILRLTDAGYVAETEPDGWQRSAVFGRSFRLTQQTDPLGQPTFTLEVRA